MIQKQKIFTDRRLKFFLSHRSKLVKEIFPNVSNVKQIRLKTKYSNVFRVRTKNFLQNSDQTFFRYFPENTLQFH